MNASAREVLDCGRRISLTDSGRLILRDEIADARLRSLLQQAGHGAAAKQAEMLIVRAAQGDDYITVTVTWLHYSQTKDAAAAGLPCALLLLRTREKKQVVRAETLQDIFSLTRAEADMASALREGATVQEYADSNQLSVNTARDRLKKIFMKTSTNRQARLVSLLDEFPF